MRVTRPDEVEGALRWAKARKKIPSLIEFIIEREENVFPIVPPGNPLGGMIFEENGNGGDGR